MTPISICLSSVAMVLLWVISAVCTTISTVLEVIKENLKEVLKWLIIIFAAFFLLHVLVILVTDAPYLWTLIKEFFAEALRTIGQLILLVAIAAVVLVVINALTGGILGILAGVVIEIIINVVTAAIVILCMLFEKIGDSCSRIFVVLLQLMNKKISEKGGEKR